MSRPLLNLSIVELTGLFEDSTDKLSVNLNLLKELRYRSTPKANALNKRVMAVIAQNASYEILQSLHVPELEALAIDCDDKPSLRASLIQVLQTRGSTKAHRLLEQLTVGAKPEMAKAAELAIVPENIEVAAVALNVLGPIAPPPLQKSALFSSPSLPTAASIQPVIAISSIPPEVEQAFSLFELPTVANWTEIEVARQRCVTKYRPGGGFDRFSASAALKQIAEAHALLADYMRNKN